MTTPDSSLPTTDHFGFTRIGPGDAISKDGYAFGDSDRVTLDNLMHALALHTHSGEPALGDPTDPPTFVPHATGGHLSAATEYFYRVSFIDRFGLETVASPEDSVSTPDPIAPPSAPAGSVESSSGTILPGVYSYMATYFDPYGGETTPSAANNVQVISGTTNRVALTFGALPTGVSGLNLYRSRPGQSQWYFLGQLTNGTVFYDDGSPEDQTITVPTSNTTSGANSIDVTIPLGFIPLGCAAWRIYRATESGGYDGNSLVHQVIEGDSDDSVVPRTVWTDTGDTLLPGVPRDDSSTFGGGNVLSLDDLSGRLPLTVVPRGSQCLTVFAPGAITDGETIMITEAPGHVRPVRFTAFFKSPPSSGQTVTLHVVSGASSVDLPCAGGSDSPAGFYHVEWPLTDAFQRYASDAPNNANASDLTQYAPYLTVSDSSAVALITDDASDTGQSLYLDNANEWGQLNMDTVEASVYSAFVSMRTNESTTSNNDVRLDVYRLDTNVVIATATYTITNVDGFAETVGLSFTAPGECQIGMRVTKLTTAAQTYEVEYLRYATTVPDLPAGQLAISASVTGSGSAADANIALWF